MSTSPAARKVIHPEAIERSHKGSSPLGDTCQDIRTCDNGGINQLTDRIMKEFSEGGRKDAPARLDPERARDALGDLLPIVSKAHDELWRLGHCYIEGLGVNDADNLISALDEHIGKLSAISSYLKAVR